MEIFFFLLFCQGRLKEPLKFTGFIAEDFFFQDQCSACADLSNPSPDTEQEYYGLNRHTYSQKDGKVYKFYIS